MKTALVFTSLLVGASSFMVGRSPVNSRAISLKGWVPEEDMTPDQLEIKGICEKWSEIRHMDREEAQEKLDGEWLEAYNRFYKKYDDDMESMQFIMDKIKDQIEPPRIKPKTKGQKKRDAWARVQAREAARAAAKPGVY